MSNLDLTINLLRGKHVTIDCNVFLLLLIGGIGLDHIDKFKRTKEFQSEDYKLLVTLIQHSRLLLTPNILTESSDLIESYDKQVNNLAFLELKRLIEVTEEKLTNSVQLTQNDCFLNFGLADSSIYDLASNGVVVITVDAPLFGLLCGKGFPVINFNHVRTERLLNK
jgi:hypothetical protein